MLLNFVDLGAGADRVVEVGRGAERLNTELPIEDAHAFAILLECVAAPADGSVELDQPAVRGLMQAVEAEPLAGPYDRVLETCLGSEQLDQPVE